MGVLHMSFDIDSVRRLIEFMYSGDYQISYNPALDILASSAPSKNCTAEKQAKEIEIGASSSIFLAHPAWSDHAEVDDSVDNTAKLDMSIDVLEPSESISGRLLFHGRMNSIADYYDVSALTKLSTARVKEILAKEWSVEAFCNLLQQCIGSTSDKDFLRMLGAEAVEHVGELSERNFFDEGGLAEGLAPYALPYCAQRLKTAEGRGRGLESSLLFEKEAGERASRELARLSQNIEECIQVLKRHQYCRSAQCDAEFRCYLDYKGPSNNPTYILRCARCRCRHE